MSAFTTIRRFASVEEARMAWGLLRSAGVEAELDNHELGSQLPLGEALIGVGLRVPEAQAEDCLAVLAYVDAGVFELPAEEAA